VSDYLGHLALRLLAPERVIQPRLPSVFEPQTTPFVPVDDVWPAAPEPARAVPRDLVEEGTPSSISALIPHRESIAADAVATREDSRGKDSAPASPEHFSGEHAKAQRSTPGIERSLLGAEPDSPLKHSSTPIAENAVAQTVSQAQSVRFGQQSVPTGTNTTPFEPEGSHATPAMEATATIVQDDVPAHGVVRERHTHRLVERLRVRHVVKESDSHGAPIEITIGRVDVRAVIGGTTPAAPPRAKKSPMLSLEDYLARREGGRR
jgi:hypothetical protein